MASRPRRRAIRSSCSSAGSSVASRRARAGYRRLLTTALGARRIFIVGFLAAVGCSFALAPFLGQNFFPPVEGDQIKLHVRAQTGTRIEETARLCDRVEAAIRATIPPDALVNIVDNIGLPISGINAAYGNSGTIGASDADILITLKPGREAEADELRRRGCASACRANFPGRRFAFLPADIVTQILNFGLPAPIDVQVIGSNLDANRAYADDLLRRIARVTGVADARIQQAFNAPTLNVDVDRTRASQVGVERTRRRDEPAGHAGRQHPDGADLLAQSEERRFLSDRRAVAAILGRYARPAWRPCPPRKADSKQLLGGVATMTRGDSDAVVSHYAVQPVIDIFATNHGRDLGAVSRRHPEHPRRNGQGRAARLDRSCCAARPRP